MLEQNTVEAVGRGDGMYYVGMIEELMVPWNFETEYSRGSGEVV